MHLIPENFRNLRALLETIQPEIGQWVPTPCFELRWSPLGLWAHGIAESEAQFQWDVIQVDIQYYGML